MMPRMKVGLYTLFFACCFLSKVCWGFDGLGFSINIPSSWIKVVDGDTTQAKLHDYGFQGMNGEEFVISVSQAAVSSRQMSLYKAALRKQDDGARKAQGLVVVWQEDAAKRANGERDTTVSYQPHKKYTSCEHIVYGADRLAVVTLVLQVKPEIARPTCFRILDSLQWKPL